MLDDRLPRKFFKFSRNDESCFVIVNATKQCNSTKYTILIHKILNTNLGLFSMQRIGSQLRLY
ncbi:hypothetical protein [Helicobacter rodentium]|uniref:hypothetical protein n=1 Tax=Helicobacter rodentium TaxID=59617 RepID=UPI0025A5AAE6|nr:hypothetical protein [Helicobacter rodentium]